MKFSTNLHVSDQNLTESIRKEMPCQLIASIPNLRHAVRSFISTSNSIVNSVRFTPTWLEREKAVKGRTNWANDNIGDLKDLFFGLTLSFRYRSDWWRANFFSRFFTMWCLTTGVGGIVKNRDNRGTKILAKCYSRCFVSRDPVESRRL